MTRYKALHRHWEQHPRAEWLVAGYLKYKPPVRAKSSDNPEDLFNFLGIVPGDKTVFG